MNLDKVPEETDSDNDDAGSIASFDSMSIPITPLKEVLSMQYSDSEEQSSGKKTMDKNEESTEKKSGKKKSMPKVNSPLPPPLQERAPPLPAQTRLPQPPPPPGEPKTMSVPLPFKKPRFSSKDLKLSKKKLRRAEEILKMVDVERADMFDKYKKYDHMPLVDSREYLRTLRAEIVSISFDGIEQLTDAFLFSLHHCKLSLTSLRWISLAGCYNITDEGIYWITQAFPTLKDIYLQGCRNFTEKGLYYLLNASKNMRNIDMSGTNVGIIPSHAAGIKVKAEGCPVVSPAPYCKSPINALSTYRKIVIMTNEKLPWSPLAVLTNQKDVPPKQELLYYSDWSPFKGHNLMEIASSARLFNIFQVPAEQGISELIISPGSIVILPYHLSDNISTLSALIIFQGISELIISPGSTGISELIISPGSIVILPYHLSDNISIVEKPTILHLAEIVASIITKHSDCTFVLLAMYKGSVPFDPVAKAEEVVECVRRRYHEWNDRLGNNLRISIHTNWRMAALTYQEQEVLSAGQRLLRQGKPLYKEDRQEVHKSTNKPMRALIPGLLKVDEGQNKDKLQFLIEAVEADEKFYPWNRQNIQSQQVLNFGETVKKNPLPLSRLESVIKSYKISDVGYQNLHGYMANLMSLATLSGHAISYPIMEEIPVVTDFKFLADVFQQLFFESAPRTVHLRSLGENIPCWTSADLEKIYPKSKATVDLLLGLLEKHGSFIKIPLDPWANLHIDGVSYVYVLYKDFPEKTCVPIETYWVPEVPISELQRDKYYFFSPGMPKSFFPNLLSQNYHTLGAVDDPMHCCPRPSASCNSAIGSSTAPRDDSFDCCTERHLFRLGGVVLLWKNGMIIQKGYITVLVEKIKEYQGLNVIVVHVRMPMYAPENSPHLKTLWTTLKLYAAVVDYMLLKYKLTAAKAVTCTSCIPSTNRYKILESKETRRFFLEHLVRVGDQRDVRCKKCEAASIANLQIGPAISLHSLVPAHDKYSMGISLNTTNILSRCLMCENCAIDGIKCPVNLKQGTSNWYCPCNKGGKLCDYCGICWRCTQYIMKVVSTLEPAFVTPKVIENVGQEQQLIAFDTVNVITKGSILGFIDVQRHEFDGEVMTANMFPVLDITFIEQSQIQIELRIFEELLEGFGETANETTPTEEGEELSSQPELPSWKSDKIQSSPRKAPKWHERKQQKVIAYNTQYGTVRLNNKTVVGPDTKTACKEGDHVRISLRYCNNEFTQILIMIECNDKHVYSYQVRAQKVALAITSLVSGISLSLSRPNKFVPVVSDYEDPQDSKKEKNCSYTVKSLPSALEMKMYSLLENIEDVLFGDRGINFTGSGMVGLPSEMSLDRLQYPAMSSLSDIKYHHLCVTWNPKSGKKNIKQFKQRFSSAISKEDPIEDRAFQPAGQTNVDTWNLSRLAHMLDSEGIPAQDAKTIDTNSSLLLWSWQYLLASYPKIFLPKNPKKLFPDGVYKDSNTIKIEEGMRQLLRLGFWKHFLNLDFNYIGTMYKSTGWGRRVEFLAMKNKIVTYATVIQELLESNISKTGLEKIQSKFNPNLDLYLCPAHRHCLRSKENLTEIVPEVFGDYAVFLAFLDLSYNKLESLPESIFEAMPNLFDFSVAFNHLDKLPATIRHCRKLNSLIVMENDLMDLPEELAELTNLSLLQAGNNRFIKLPDVIMKITSLTTLTTPYMMLTEIPESIGNLVNLRKLLLQGNCFTKLPKSFEKLTQLEEVNLGGIPWVKIKSSSVLSYDGFRFFLGGNKLDRWLEANEKDHKELFQFFDENSNGVLDFQEIGKLNAAMYNLFPRFGYKGSEQPDETSTTSGFPMELLSCTKLQIINMEYQGIVSVPPAIENLKELTQLNLNFNPNLLGIPAELGKIETLKALQLDECPLLKTPPKEIRDKGFQSIFAYLQRLLSGALLSKRTKLMLVGLGGAGKTSLVRALMSSDEKADLSRGDDITDGIEINTWKIHKDGDDITYNVWDFAGQTVYYNTHQFFLSNRAVYLLLWNVRLGHEHAGLDFWLSSISVQCPKAPIFVVGSHIDQVNKTELPIHEMQQRYPQIVGFHFVSSLTGKGIAELKEKLFNITLQQEYMGEHIPAVWLTFENNIASNRAKQNIIDYRHIETIANQSGIFDSSEIFQAVQFLHDLGTIQHFTNEFLKDKVVINPQWIVDVMACVVSVKTQVIKEGRLHHSDIADIWVEYPRNLHNWLLRLTEEFDLTFQLNNEPINLVPCLLPEKKPEFEWPEVEKGTDVKETQMIYKFDYLPAGLFNRGQVRLHMLSDSSLIWKKGSFLKKNVHIALIQQTRDSELVVLVQGPRPENILFLVHEVFEGLIVESFHGVQYDFLLPCPECSRMAVKDKHMFAASTIRRAIEMKAPFLQCIKYFHTISCADLLTLLPPDSHSDFDAHLVQSVQGLRDLRKDLSADIFISHCQMDNNVPKDTLITPDRVYANLKAKGYKCWYADKNTNASTDEMAKALIDSSVFVAFVSTNYAGMDECVNIFKYARLTLRKNMVVVALGESFDWKQSKIGILLADEVYVNMTKQKLEHYESKFDELLRALSGKTRMVSEVTPKPVVFFSYTWVNSAEAVELGTREIPGALGYGDPRRLKQYLEDHGVTCWIDVERVGMNGLFDDIAEGLLSAKVVIVCVSDEYAASHTCQIEFRYAANTLKLPIIVAAVGTGDAWRATEVGLLSVYYPIVNFQEKTKHAKSKLLKLVQDRLGEGDDAETLKAQKEKANERHKNLSFQELFELAQRKLLRQLALYAENQDTDVYPRLFVADFLKDESREPADDLDLDEKEKTDESENKNKDREEEEKPPKEEKSNSKPKLLQKQSTHSILSKKSSTLQPAYKLNKFCVYILCEHDEGWHSVSEPLELPADFGSNHLETFSPYLARMTAVMKYNKRMVLSCLEDEVGQDYIRWLEESPEATMSDYQTVYHRFREMVMEVDTNKLMGNLARCHLPNGKTIWLCQKHRDSARVTVLSNQEKTVRFKSDYSSKVNSYMVQALRAMDHLHFSSQFRASRKAKRAMDGSKFRGGSRISGKGAQMSKGKSFKEMRKANKAANKKFREMHADKERQEKKQKASSETATVDKKEAGSETKQSSTADEKSKVGTELSAVAKGLENSQKATDRQISKDSITSGSTVTASRQTSVSTVTASRQTSVSTVTTSRQTSEEPLQDERRAVRRQRSQDQASVSSRDSSASFQRHRDQQNQGGSMKHLKSAKTKSRACSIS